jgi:hypothetical protein
MAARGRGFGPTTAILLATLIGAGIGGCAVPPERPSDPGTARQLIGTVRVDGPEVFLNGLRAQDGSPAYDGDRVSTRAGSSAVVEFSGGGFVQLDESTDPEFTFRLLREGWCLLVKILTGQMFVDSGNRCIEVETPQMVVSLNSRVNIQVTGQGDELTVLEGRVTISRPLGLRVGPTRRVVIAGSKVEGPLALSTTEIARVTAWRDKYFRPVPPRPSISVPNVIGMPLRAAEQRLRDAGLTVGRESEAESRRYPPGTVIDQRPAPESPVPAGSRVDLVIEGRRPPPPVKPTPIPPPTRPVPPAPSRPPS